MSAELIGKFWLVVLCAPGIVPALIFYRRHCKEKPRGERLPLGLYVVALLICSFIAFWAGAEWGVRSACSGPSSGNLCGLLGLIVVGPLSSIIAVSILSWLLTSFPRQLKHLVLAGVLLFVLANGYYFRGFLFSIVSPPAHYQYTLQSGNLDELQRVAPKLEAEMRRLPVLENVGLDSRIDRQKAAASGAKDLPTMRIVFGLAPKVALGDAVTQIHDMEVRLALPASITTSLAKAPKE